MATSADLSAGDFQRLQDSLLELRTQNCSLEDQCRKQKSALGDATARASVLEQELVKAQRVLQRSKKASEVQQLVRERDTLQNKLRAQEDDFRLQNQTLLQELATLVTSNQKLEEEIRSARPETSSTASVTSDETDHGLRQENERLRQDLQNVTSSLERAEEENTRLKSLQESDKRSASPELVLEGGGVAFRRKGSQEQQDIEKQIEELKDERDLVVEELHQTKRLLSQAQNQSRQLIEELETKQALAAQVHSEKDAQIKRLNDKVSELSDNSAGSITELGVENERLQAQLQKGYDAFNLFKEKRAVDVTKLEEQIASLNDKLSGISKLEENLQSHEAALASKTSELELKETELVETKDYLAQLQDELESERKDFQLKLEDAIKVGENRKSLLDEMAINLQNKSDEISRLANEVSSSKVAYEEQMKDLGCQVSDLKLSLETSHRSESEQSSRMVQLTAEVSELSSKLSQLSADSERHLKEVQETHADEVRVLVEEHKLKLRDLATQLEISNAQRNEFEESCQQATLEAKDLIEERKIADRKAAALNKDLKRQLQAEKQRNDRLQERLKECFADSTTSSSPSPPSHMSREIDADRTSISSWSIMSGYNDQSHSTPLPVESSEVHSSPASPSEAIDSQHDDHVLLLEKIQRLQDEKQVSEEKIHMLEHSAAAMADELLRKSALIQFYCMDGRKAAHSSALAAPVLSPSGEKQLSMKDRMVNLLMHPDQETRREVERMQNMLEETLTKNMHLQTDLESLSREVVRLSKEAIGNKQKEV